MKRLTWATFGIVVSFIHCSALSAVVIKEQLIQAGGAATFALGQSLTTPAGGPWNALTFNWFTSTTAPLATGTLYLIDREYLGTPASLSTLTPGYIAHSQSIVASQYVFAPAVAIQPNATYFFFTNATVPGNSGDGDVIPGTAYGSLGSAPYMRIENGFDARFRLQGNVVPEPSCIAIAFAGYSVLWMTRHHRRIGRPE